MSNIYIQEPPTLGKVLLKTTAGDIDIELWSKECPKTCKNFIQLCMEGYYNGTIFHRVVKNFIVQGGDPSGDGTGGESIYGEPFKDEFHQRLRFNRRGLVAMANAGKDDNGSQFFFTLSATPELQNKHTLFGKVTGDTVFNMLKLAEGVVENETPLYPYKIVKAEVLNNPFPDIVPRELRPKKVVKETSKKEKTTGVKNFKLLSFGEEAEEDEEETKRETEKFSIKGKSSHDVLDDPKLSSYTEDLETNPDSDPEKDTERQLENIRDKLKGGSSKKSKSLISKQRPISEKNDNDDSDEKELDDYYLGKDRDVAKKRKLDELKKEMQEVKKEYHQNKLRKEEELDKKSKKEEEKSEVVKEFEDEYNKYKDRKKALPKKGAGREEFTLQLLEGFKKKLRDAKEKENDVEEEKQAEESIEDKDDESLFSHKLHFSDDLVLAKDANTKDDDWFEIYDPRNPLNKRRRGEDFKKSKK